jgi:hypothetical protein
MGRKFGKSIQLNYIYMNKELTTKQAILVVTIIVILCAIADNF